MLFEGQVASTKSLNILYDDVERHYHVIAKFTAATARRYVCKWFNKSRRLDVTHACDQTCSDCMASCPCAFSLVLISCSNCNRHFSSSTCYEKYKQRTINNTSSCKRKRCCATSGWAVRHENNECNKRFFDDSRQNKELCHLCYRKCKE